MDITNVIQKMLVLFIAMAVGFIAYKCKRLDEEGNKKITKLVLNVTLPFTIINSVMNKSAVNEISGIGNFVLLTACAYILLGIISWGLPLLLRVEPGKIGTYRFMCYFGNVAFMGYPVIEAVMGQGAVFYTSIYNVPFNALAFTIGIVMIRGRSPDGKIRVRQLFSAPLVASLLSVVIFALDLRFPVVITESVSLLSNATTPLSMLVTGSILAQMPVKELFTEWRLYLFSLLRLIAVPVIIRLIFRPLAAGAMVLGVQVVMASLPVAMVSTMLSLEHGGDHRTSSKGVFITTVLSMFTIPLLCYLLL